MERLGFRTRSRDPRDQQGLLPERRRLACWSFGMAMLVLGGGLVMSGGVQAREGEIATPDSPHVDRQCSSCLPAPTANAGSDQTVDSGADVQLSGSGSSYASSYSWIQLNGPTVTLSGASTLSPSFTAPNVTSQTNLVFRLRVTRWGLSASDSVTITVNPLPPPPTVDAGPNQTVFPGSTVTLSGSATGGHGTKSWAWTQTGGSPTVTLSNANQASASFTAPPVTAATDLEFTLTVTDASGSATDTVTVTVRPSLGAEAGPDQTVASGAPVTLSGSATGGSGTKSYTWTQTEGSPTVTLSDADQASASFMAPTVTTATTLGFTLAVTAGSQTATDTVDVTVAVAVFGSEPQAVVGADQEAVGGAIVTLDGSGSSAPNDVQSYAWTQTSGTSVTLSDSDRSIATFTAPSTANGRRIIEERLGFTLTVTDQVGLTSTDSLEVIVTTSAIVSGVSIISRPLSGDTYGEGDRIRARIAYDEVVSISGSPQLSLRVGTQAHSMSYVGMDRSRVLDFEYVVQATDTDTDGVSITSDLSLPSGASITNRRGVAASLSLGRSILNASKHKVNGSQTILSPTPGVTGCSE